MNIPKQFPSQESLQKVAALYPWLKEGGIEIMASLPQPEEWKAARLFKYQTLPSTQICMRDHANTVFRSGDVVWAQAQTQGKGRGTHAWSSSLDYSLTFSLILKRKRHRENVFYTQLVALALARGLEGLTANPPRTTSENKSTPTAPASRYSVPLHCTLKWPNDILIQGKKVAGILIDTTPVADSLTQTNLIIGIGLNALESPEVLAQYHKQFQASDYPATSFYQETGKAISLASHLRAFLSEFIKLETLCLAGATESIVAEWQKRNQLIGRTIDLGAKQTSKTHLWGPWQVQKVSLSGLVTLTSLHNSQSVPNFDSEAKPSSHAPLPTIKFTIEELGL